jgi:hypothetical protein
MKQNLNIKAGANYETKIFVADYIFAFDSICFRVGAANAKRAKSGRQNLSTRKSFDGAANAL